MALSDLYNLATQPDSVALKTVGGAAFKAANDILNESVSEANHGNRRGWALAYLENPTVHAVKLLGLSLSNSTLLADFTADPVNEVQADGDAQFVVNSILSNAELLARLGFGEAD